MPEIADGSVAEIYASHVLEHLSYVDELHQALAEFHRVLAPGGTLMASVPDFNLLCQAFSCRGADDAAALRGDAADLGGQSTHTTAHRSG